VEAAALVLAIGTGVRASCCSLARNQSSFPRWTAREMGAAICVDIKYIENAD
jgi:predicted MarR family transcription regulator